MDISNFFINLVFFDKKRIVLSLIFGCIWWVLSSAVSLSLLGLNNLSFPIKIIFSVMGLPLIIFAKFVDFTYPSGLWQFIPKGEPVFFLGYLFMAIIMAYLLISFWEWFIKYITKSI